MNYRLYDGFNVLEAGQNEMTYIRLRGKALAEKNGKRVRCELYNECRNRWEYVGTSMPDGYFINSYGDRCKLDENGRNYRIIKDKENG